MASELWRGVHAFIIILALLVTSAMMFGKMILTTSGCRWKSNVWLCWPQIRDLKYEMPLQLDLRWSLSVTHFDPQSLSTSSCFKTLQYIHIRKFSLWIAAIYLEKKQKLFTSTSLGPIVPVPQGIHRPWGNTHHNACRPAEDVLTSLNWLNMSFILKSPPENTWKKKTFFTIYLQEPTPAHKLVNQQDKKIQLNSNPWPSKTAFQYFSINPGSNKWKNPHTSNHWFRLANWTWTLPRRSVGWSPQRGARAHG